MAVDTSSSSPSSKRRRDSTPPPLPATKNRGRACEVCDKSISYYPATVNSISKTASAATNDRTEDIDDMENIMILCTSEPELLEWETISVKAIQGDLLNKLVPAGYEQEVPRYIGKAFYDNEWIISSVYQHGDRRAGLNHYGKDNHKIIENKFQILKWKSKLKKTTGGGVPNQNWHNHFNIRKNLCTPSKPNSISLIDVTPIELKSELSSIELNLPGIQMDEYVEWFIAVIVTKLSTQSQLQLDLFSLSDEKLLKAVQVPQNHLSWVAWKNIISKHKPITVHIGDDTGSNRLLLEDTKYNITLYIKNIYNNNSEGCIWSKEKVTLNRQLCLPCES
ncbi:uncharacterized protein [Onthophagus taurus]|uniref:uncharacterized protein isoform X2 n=1 Tax=Onthophagus taurus TaxID=166361 RepID=UPI0039BECA79